MEPKLGSVDIFVKSRTNTSVHESTNGDWGCSLYVKRVGVTFLVVVHGRSAERVGAYWDG